MNVCAPLEAVHEGTACEKLSDNVPESDVADPKVPLIVYDGLPLDDSVKLPFVMPTGVPNVVVVLPVTVHPPVAFHPNDTWVTALLLTVNVMVLSCEVLPLHVPS